MGTSRKQSLVDAERLMSGLVVQSLQRHGFEREATFVEVMANWHEATDGRGISQLQRCRIHSIALMAVAGPDY